MAEDNTAMMDEAESAPAEPQQEGEGHSLFIAPEDLPAGMKLNPGDIVEFKVVGEDADGHWELKYAAPEKSGMDRMKSDLAEHMSAPANPETEGRY